MQGNATETVITTVDTPVKVAGAFVVGRNSGFTPDTTGKITYDLVVDVVIPISCSMSLQSAAGGTDKVTAYVAIDGVIDANSGISTIIDNTGEQSVTLTWQELLVSGGEVEVFVENNNDTSNILVVAMVLRVQ